MRGRGMRHDKAALLSAIGAIAVAAALSDRNGNYSPGSLALVTLAGACALWAAASGQPWRSETPAGDALGASPGWAGVVLRVAAIVGIAALVLAKPGYELRPAHPLAFHVLAAMALGVAAAPRAKATERVRRLRFPLLALLWVAMAAVVLHASPHPLIDVWRFQQIAVETLWNGGNPYTATYPNIYASERWYAPEMLSGGRVTAFTYPPLTVYTGLPAWLLFGDVRIALLAATLAAAWAIRRLGGTGSAEDAALVLLFHPKAFLMLEKGWTEPLLLAPAVLAAVAALELRGTRRWLASGAALGLAAASKQFSVLVLPPFPLALPREGRSRALVVAAVVAVASFMPYLVVSPRALWRGLVTYQLVLPFREESLSWMVPLARVLGRPMPAWPALAVAAAVLAATLPRRNLLALAATSAWATLSVFVLFANRSHFNYYWLSMSLALVASVLHQREVTQARRSE